MTWRRRDERNPIGRFSVSSPVYWEREGGTPRGKGRKKVGGRERLSVTAPSDNIHPWLNGEGIGMQHPQLFKVKYGVISNCGNHCGWLEQQSLEHIHQSKEAIG